MSCIFQMVFLVPVPLTSTIADASAMKRLVIISIALLVLSAQAFQIQLPIRKLSLTLSPSKTIAHSPRFQPFNMATSDDDMSHDISNEKSLATNVLYSIGASTSLLVSVAFFIVLAVQRDALMVSFFMGAITNGALSKVLKKILNQDRPADTVNNAEEQPSDKGMPSSHAMSLGFIGTFTMLTLEWTSILVPVYVAISLYYRVQTRLHTVAQVAVGMVFGVTHGFVWKHLVDGSNPFGIHITDFVSNNVLNDQGLLPIPLLVVPALAGAVIVGSMERKISKFLKKKAA